jgi:GR25 family glycosyltransferase involved in LPS biosynthesis
LFFSLFVNCKIETFEEKDNSDMKMYVISLKQPKRIENIETQEKKLGKNITIIDAVKGDILDIDELIDKGLISEKSYKKSNIEYKKREIGCYMSHLKIYNLIKSSEPDNYSIIFEDDFNLENDNFLEIVNEIIFRLKKQ